MLLPHARFVAFTVGIAPSEFYYKFLTAWLKNNLDAVAAGLDALGSGSLLFYAGILLAEAHLHLGSPTSTSTVPSNPRAEWLRLAISTGFAPVVIAGVAFIQAGLAGPWLKAELLIALYALVLSICAHYMSK